MTGGLSIMYYTCNRIKDSFAERVREHLLESAAGLPIICVTQKPLAFGDINICVGEIGATTWNCYAAILAGARAASTRFVACAEDDSLYHASHFVMRPTPGRFAYNKNKFWLEPKTFRWRDRTGMFSCLVETELLVADLEDRFSKVEPLSSESEYRAAGWGEPGRYPKHLGGSRAKLEYVRSSVPIITVNHRDSLGGLRKWNATDVLQETLEPWGSARELWKRFYG